MKHEGKENGEYIISYLLSMISTSLFNQFFVCAVGGLLFLILMTRTF